MKPPANSPDVALLPGGAAALPQPTFWHSLRKYRKIWRVAIADRMVYRTDFILSTFLRFLPMLTTILLWQAIYAGTEQDELAGYRLNEMISYLLLVHISRMFSSMPGLASSIARDIREGSLKKYLLQPIDMISYLATYRVAHKMTYILMSALPYAILFYLCLDFLPGWPDGWTLCAYAVSLLLAFLIGFFFEACLGMIGFWFLEVTSFLYIIGTITFFVSGQMFPLDLLGPFWVRVFQGLPFQYLAYFPAAVFLGKIQGPELVNGLLLELFWAVLLIVIARWIFYVGLRRYSAYGG